MRTGVRIAGAESAAQVGPTISRDSSAAEWDDRERDLRPGRYAVRGPFIDLAALEEAEANLRERRGA
jgi:hypothetical protein